MPLRSQSIGPYGRQWPSIARRSPASWRPSGPDVRLHTYLSAGPDGRRGKTAGWQLAAEHKLTAKEANPPESFDGKKNLRPAAIAHFYGRTRPRGRPGESSGADALADEHLVYSETTLNV